jgi:hypothetical protein
MQIEFEVHRMRPASGVLPTGSKLVAAFDVSVFPFRIHGGQIRRRPDGALWATLPGRKDGGISISSPELLEAIRETAVSLYNERLSDGAWTQA